MSNGKIGRTVAIISGIVIILGTLSATIIRQNDVKHTADDANKRSIKNEEVILKSDINVIKNEIIHGNKAIDEIKQNQRDFEKDVKDKFDDFEKDMDDHQREVLKAIRDIEK